MACWQSSDCACFMLHRECDPDLCGNCGAGEALGAHAYTQDHDDWLGGPTCCSNVSITRGLLPRLNLGKSQISGFGLFAGVGIYQHGLIGEYKGEIVSSGEANRRKTFHENHPREYTFELNKTQELDATYAGNKIRFINNSKKHANCEACPLSCQGVSRLGLFAIRDIQAGEEILFDYGYPEEKQAQAGFRDLAQSLAPVKSKKQPKKSGGAHPVIGSSNDEDVLCGVLSQGEPSIGYIEDPKLKEILDKQGFESDDEDYAPERSSEASPGLSSSDSPSKGTRKRKAQL